ncbi:MAG: hypothetical protein HOO06_12380 [Bdellovibrionaceae bacterium]|jgi:hypothetical protein|nr:hypothetical protein [Pseudobdellovibrionaceae bacterium]
MNIYIFLVSIFIFSCASRDLTINKSKNFSSQQFSFNSECTPEDSTVCTRFQQGPDVKDKKTICIGKAHSLAPKIFRGKCAIYSCSDFQSKNCKIVGEPGVFDWWEKEKTKKVITWIGAYQSESGNSVEIMRKGFGKYFFNGTAVSGTAEIAVVKGYIYGSKKNAQLTSEDCNLSIVFEDKYLFITGGENCGGAGLTFQGKYFRE